MAKNKIFSKALCLFWKLGCDMFAYSQKRGSMSLLTIKWAFCHKHDKNWFRGWVWGSVRKKRGVSSPILFKHCSASTARRRKQTLYQSHRLVSCSPPQILNLKMLPKVCFLLPCNQITNFDVKRSVFVYRNLGLCSVAEATFASSTMMDLIFHKLSVKMWPLNFTVIFLRKITILECLERQYNSNSLKAKS